MITVICSLRAMQVEGKEIFHEDRSTKAELHIWRYEWGESYTRKWWSNNTPSKESVSYTRTFHLWDSLSTQQQRRRRRFSYAWCVADSQYAQYVRESESKRTYDLKLYAVMTYLSFCQYFIIRHHLHIYYKIALMSHSLWLPFTLRFVPLTHLSTNLKLSYFVSHFLHHPFLPTCVFSLCQYTLSDLGVEIYRMKDSDIKFMLDEILSGAALYYVCEACIHR